MHKRKKKRGSLESVIDALGSFHEEILSLISQTNESLNSTKQMLKSALKNDFNNISKNLISTKDLIKDIEDIKNSNVIKSYPLSSYLMLRI